jgi:hypothetical protein
VRNEGGFARQQALLTTRHPVERWHELVEARDPSAPDELLHAEAVFLSPVVHSPQRGRALTRAYLAAAIEVFRDPSFRYVREIVGPNDAVLEFETTIDGVLVNGVDLLRWNAAPEILEFMVTVRPLKAIQVVHERMATLLASRASRGAG